MSYCDEADQCRATISLVCQAWYRVEREHPHQPEQLHVDLEDFNATFMIWHLRDTSRLREVKFLQKELNEYPWQVKAGESYWEWMPKLLRHISVSAPALRRLDMVSPAENISYKDREPPRWMGRVLPLIGELTHLESLVLRNWKYCTAGADSLSHLTRLQNLKVSAFGLPEGLTKQSHFPLPDLLLCLA